MTLTEEQEKKQPLLDKFGIIIAPETIDYDAYFELSWALQIGRDIHPEKPLELRCNGNGGITSSALAIYDLLVQDGNVDGIAVGNVCSAHSMIWCGCKRRYCYPNVTVRIHQAKRGAGWEATYIQSDYELIVEQFTSDNRRVTEIYARASNQDVDYWTAKLFDTRIETFNLYPLQLFELEMSMAISERK